MKRLNVFISVVLSIIVAISCSNEDENVSINANTSRPIIINFRKMRLLFVLVLLGSLFLNSCNKEEENNVENIEISDVFYEDFFDVDNIGLVRDSLYFINSEEKLKQITNDFPSVYAKISKTDFDKNTVVITASRQDYNLFKYEL